MGRLGGPGLDPRIAALAMGAWVLWSVRYVVPHGVLLHLAASEALIDDEHGVGSGCDCWATQ